MAFISEEHELPFPVNLNYWINIYRNLYPSFNESIFKNLVQKLEIDIEKSFHSLSRGQKMKALFCLQAPKRPNIYLLDEITAVLDAGSRWTLMQFLKEEVSRGCLVVMSTNIASEMHGFATHLTFLEKGKVIFSSDSGSISDHFRKIRVSKEKEASLPPNLFAKRISYNGDGTWIYMFKKSYNAAPIGIEDDAREITISDVQSYFTTEEGAV
jgi:ABC-2 type transport system ATP-binding protein